VDDIDRAILRQLQADGRLANNELADRVGLSPSPCLRRVRASAIRCDYEPLVWVTLSSVTRETMLEFEAATSAIANITEVNRMMGQPDYLLRVVTSDADAFEELYIDVLAGLPHVQTLTSQVSMKLVKRTHELPIAESGV
jgi:DNA-binding Lrp family transcriptional regulator